MTEPRRDVAALAREIISAVVDYVVMDATGRVRVKASGVSAVAALLHPVRHRTSEGLWKLIQRAREELPNPNERPQWGVPDWRRAVTQARSTLGAALAHLRSEPSEDAVEWWGRMDALLKSALTMASVDGDPHLIREIERARSVASVAPLRRSEPPEGREADAWIAERRSVDGKTWRPVSHAGRQLHPTRDAALETIYHEDHRFRVREVYFGTPSDSPDRCPQCGYEPATRIERGPLSPGDSASDSPTGEADLCICTGEHGSNPNCAYDYQEPENGTDGTRLASDSPEREGPSDSEAVFRRGYHVGYADGRMENPEDPDWHLAIDGPDSSTAEPAESEEATMEVRTERCDQGHRWRQMLMPSDGWYPSVCPHCHEVIEGAAPSPEGVEDEGDWTVEDWSRWAYQQGLKLDGVVPLLGATNRQRIGQAIERLATRTVEPGRPCPRCEDGRLTLHCTGCNWRDGAS